MQNLKLMNQKTGISQAQTLTLDLSQTGRNALLKKIGRILQKHQMETGITGIYPNKICSTIESKTGQGK